MDKKSGIFYESQSAEKRQGKHIPLPKLLNGLAV
jgi:hypothetical protein